MLGLKILKQLAEFKGHDYILIDYRMVIKTLDQPILYMPFNKEFIFDLLFGRVSMLFMFDFDEFFELYPMYGLKAEWGSRKASHKVREKMKSNALKR